MYTPKFEWTKNNSYFLIKIVKIVFNNMIFLSGADSEIINGRSFKPKINSFFFSLYTNNIKPEIF